MCGISGVISQSESINLQAVISQMNQKIEHRGPDGEGTYFGQNFSFGHRRLSIIDLTDNSHQPMILDDKLVLTFNGEIYNYIEIREELLNLGYKFKTTGDTEVILKSYQQWGEKCVERFNGMWAFALYDKEKNRIFCSRDRFGIKPFYFLKKGTEFYFGSEIKQLSQFQPDQKVNRKILFEYLITGLEEFTDECFFEGVLKLSGGHNLIYSLKDYSYTIESFYHLNIQAEDVGLNENEAIEKYESKLLDSVKLRMRSDVKVGTCLSGGLDSSSIAAIAGNIYNAESSNQFTAIHAKSTEKATDESHLARSVADHCNIDLHIVEPTTKDFVSMIDEVIYTQEEPFGGPSIFMQYFVMQKAKELNCKVLLDGQGGDETLLGYEKYYPAYILNKKGLGKIKAFLDSSKNSKLSRIDVLKYFFYFTKYKVRLKRLKSKSLFIKQEFLDVFESKALQELSKKYLDINELQKHEILKTQLPHLLKYEDKNSMRNSIETRLPLIDYKVLETAISLDGEHKIKDGWTKFVLRKVVDKLLPKEIVWRKNKLGFNAPDKTWLDSIDTEIQETVKNSEFLKEFLNLDRLNWSQITLKQKWRLFNTAKWAEIYKVKF